MTRRYFVFLAFTLCAGASCSTPPAAPPEKAPDENAAIEALEAVNQAQQDFIRRTRRYALTYDELVRDYLLKEKPTSETTGYDVILKPSPDAVSYTIIATPGSDAEKFRHFFTDKTGVIRAETGRAATAESPEM